MKKLVLLITICLFYTSIFSQTMFKVENFNYFDYGNSDNFKAVANIYAQKKISDKISVYSFFAVNKVWGEGFLGVKYSPFKKLSLAFGAGMESHEDLWRTNHSVFVGDDKISLFYYGEIGSSGNWFSIEAKYRITNPTKSTKLKIGVLARKYFGVGPRLDIYTKSGLYFWTCPVQYDWLSQESQKIVNVSAIGMKF
ncbi:MAG: hypothetical protein ACI9AR_000251 [Flavobacteriaceae bacterium]|jgi:hypothetical protein